MWFLFIITVLNAACDQQGIILEHRVKLGPLPVNLIDGTLIAGLLLAVVGFSASKSRFVSDKAHSLFLTILIVSTIAGCAGLAVGMTRAPSVYDLVSGMNHFIALPLSIVLGYYFLKGPRSVHWFPHLHVLGGVLCAGLITFFFFGKASGQGASQSIEAVRVVSFISSYAGMAAALLLYTMACRSERLYPLLIAFALAAFCLVGQFGTLARSDWLSASAALLVVPFLFKPPNRGRKAAFVAVILPMLIVALVVSAVILSNVTGRDIAASLAKRVGSALPTARGDDSYSSRKAWDTRLPGVIEELKLWSNSPLYGHGFGYSKSAQYFYSGVAFNHNVWSASLATLGILGFAAYLIPVLGIIVVGRRLIRDGTDRGSILIGVIGVTAGAMHLVLGASTMSFNVQRGAIALGLIVGVVLRARAIQLTQIRLNEYWGDIGEDQLYEAQYDYDAAY